MPCLAEPGAFACRVRRPRPDWLRRTAVSGCASLDRLLDGAEVVAVTRVEEIQSAIVALSREDYALLRQWFVARNWESWDSEFETDAASGKLDFLIREATHEKNRGRLREL